jgi:phosphonoacetaldehyde dehydrogenase
VSAALRPMRIGAARVTTDDVIEVRSPYDGRLVGTVPRGTATDLDAAVAAAAARHH